MKRTALFFGSFNPIHVGHLIIANSMLQHEGVDELWLVVSPQNPLKERATLLADHHRLQMVQRAIDDNYRLKVCDIEMHLPIPSYTVVTLAALQEKYPDRLQVQVAEGVPFAQYQAMMNNADAILDQLYSYTPAMNSLLATSPMLGFSLSQASATMARKTVLRNATRPSMSKSPSPPTSCRRDAYIISACGADLQSESYRPQHAVANLRGI